MQRQLRGLPAFPTLNPKEEPGMGGWRKAGSGGEDKEAFGFFFMRRSDSLFLTTADLRLKPGTTRKQDPSSRFLRRRKIKGGRTGSEN